MCRSTPDKEPSGAESVSGTEAIEGFAVGLYTEVFQAIMSLINRYLQTVLPFSSDLDDLCHLFLDGTRDIELCQIAVFNFFYHVYRRPVVVLAQFGLVSSVSVS